MYLHHVNISFRYCNKPASVAPFEWDKSDITKWPVSSQNLTQQQATCLILLLYAFSLNLKFCNFYEVAVTVFHFYWMLNWHFFLQYCEDTGKPVSNVSSKIDRHMSCDITGRPCCHGIQGECMITTREHCNFIKGYYHEDKYLCSQVKKSVNVCIFVCFCMWLCTVF